MDRQYSRIKAVVSLDAIAHNFREMKKNINDIQNLVVPHHACELDTSDEGVLNLKTNCSNGKAIICSGYNTYSHPNNDHKNLLKQKFLFVETTGGAANSNKFERININ